MSASSSLFVVNTNTLRRPHVLLCVGWHHFQFPTRINLIKRRVGTARNPNRQPDSSSPLIAISVSTVENTGNRDRIFCWLFEEAHKARLRTAIQRRNSLVLWAERLIPGLLCACSSKKAVIAAPESESYAGWFQLFDISRTVGKVSIHTVQNLQSSFAVNGSQIRPGFWRPDDRDP